MSYTLQESKSVLMQRVSVSAGLVAPSVTDGTGAIDTGKLASLVERLALTGVHGVARLAGPGEAARL
jgi:dihydrodipicolinate synthase/N-acetylneuraminate lyase